MKWIATYLSVGVVLTFAWNIQVQNYCGKPLSFSAFVFGFAIMPIATPIIMWSSDKPDCRIMTTKLPGYSRSRMGNER